MLYKAKGAIALKRFKRFYIEITNVCNLTCDFCPKTNRAPKFMSVSEFNYILNQIQPFTDYVYLHVKGEPLLHPELESLLEQCLEHGLKVNITTNGTLLHKVSEALLKYNCVRQINISLHSMNGNEGYHQKDEYMDRILNFIDLARNQSELIISLRFWNLDKNNEINLLYSKNEEYLKRIENHFQLPYKIDDTITPGNGIKLADRLYLNQDHTFDWPDLLKEEDDGIGYCYGLKSQIGVLVDGTIIPCCLDGEGVINLGNIFKDSLSDVLNSERANDIINGFSNRLAVEELCKKCGYRKKFNK